MRLWFRRVSRRFLTAIVVLKIGFVIFDLHSLLFWFFVFLVLIFFVVMRMSRFVLNMIQMIFDQLLTSAVALLFVTKLFARFVVVLLAF